MIPELRRSVGGTDNSWVNWSIVSGGKNGSRWVQGGSGGTFGLGSCSPLEDLRSMSYSGGAIGDWLVGLSVCF